MLLTLRKINLKENHTVEYCNQNLEQEISLKSNKRRGKHIA